MSKNLLVSSFMNDAVQLRCTVG
nr:hypothetical protein [Rickettsia endosymbiont of Ceutorhynchus assimilis]